MKEFESLTGKNIHIIDFKPKNDGNHSSPKSQEFLNIILGNSNNLKITAINISYLEIKDEVRIYSIRGSPLYFNLSSLFPKSICPENFKSKIETLIKDKFLSFGFNVDNLKFNFSESEIVGVHVYLRNYKLWFIDILAIDIELGGGEFIVESDFDINFSTELDGLDMYDEHFKEIDGNFRETIISILEKRGYYHIDPTCIEYIIAEFIPPD